MAALPRRTPLLLLLFTLVTRLPALTYPKAIDDTQVYSVVAIEMLHGGKPYLDAIERKPPLLFVLFKEIFVVAGAYNWFALHLTALVWTLATMALLWLIAARLFDDTTGATAALLYALFLAWGDYRNLAPNGELLMNLPVVAAFALTLRGREAGPRPELLLAGALIAMAFLLKQPSGIAGVPLGLYVMHPDYQGQRGIGWRMASLHAGLLALGFVAVLVATVLLLSDAGILQEAVYWSVLSQGAAFGIGTWVFWDRALSDSAFFLVSTLPLGITALLSMREGAGAGKLWEGHRAELMALVVLLGVSIVGVAVNGQFLYHYYLQLIPPLALLAAPMVGAILDGRRRFRLPLLAPRGLTGWLALSALVFLVVDTIGLSRNREPAVTAQYVREHSNADDRIFVWGQGTRQTGMYLDARRRPATRYIASFPLTGHIFGSPVSWDPDYDTSDRIVPGAWDNLRQDFGRHAPRYIIDTDAVRPRPMYPIAKYPVLRDYLATEYREVFRAADGIVYERTDR